MISNLDKALHWALKLACPVLRVRARAEGDKGAKTPIDFNGHLSATMDEATIRRWWTERPDALVGVAAGAAGIVVADVDMGEDKDGWASIFEAGLEGTLIDQTFHHQSNSGGDHFIFADPGNVPLNGTRDHVMPDGRKLKDVDRRGGSSYIIIWGNDLPADRSVFKPAPDWLLTPAPEPEKNPYGGTVEQWLERCSRGEPSPLVRAWVDQIPNDFDHTMMIASQRQLIGWAVEGESGIPWAVDRLKAAWLAGQWNTREYQRDFQVSLRGAIEKFGAFPPGPRDIGLNDDYLKHANAVEASGFLDVWSSLPPSSDKDAMRSRVVHVASVALADGLPMLAAADLAWSSAAARDGIRRRLTEDEAKIEVWNAVQEALARPTDDAEAPLTPAVDEPDGPKPRRVQLLSPRERAALENIRSSVWGEQYRWWGDAFMHAMHESYSLMSEPYYRLNRWFALALIFADKAVLRADNGDEIIFNFYGVMIGPSSSGKSQAWKPVTRLVDKFYAEGNDPSLGGDSTRSALNQTLIARFKERGIATSIFHADEADSVLRDWSDEQGPFRGMKQFVTQVWEGDIPAFDRSTLKDLSGIKGRGMLSIHLFGIEEKIEDAIEPGDWTTGFVNRIIFARGERKHKTDEMRRPRFGGPSTREGAPHTDFYSEWANKFRAICASLGLGNSLPSLNVKDDVLDRYVEAEKRLESIALAQAGYVDQMEATVSRLRTHVWKCAALIAITERRMTIQMTDFLLALEQVEEWAEESVEMVMRTDQTRESRGVQSLLKVIRENGGIMQRKQIYRREEYSGREKVADMRIESAEKQRRLEVLRDGSPLPEQKVRLLKDAA